MRTLAAVSFTYSPIPLSESDPARLSQANLAQAVSEAQHKITTYRIYAAVLNEILYCGAIDAEVAVEDVVGRELQFSALTFEEKFTERCTPQRHFRIETIRPLIVDTVRKSVEKRNCFGNSMFNSVS